jgi:hypothetical protein
MTKFDISSNDIRAEGGKALAAGLKGNKVIKELNISSNYSLGKNSRYAADTSGFIAIADVLPGMGALSSANFLGNYIPVEQAQELVEIMRTKENLTTLCGLSGEETKLDFSNRSLGGGDAVLIANDIKDMGAIFSVQRDALLSFYEQHDAQYVDHVDQFLQEYSAQELVDWCQEEYGSSPTTTPKAKGALSLLNLTDNNIGEERVQKMKEMCVSRNISLLIN